MDPIVKQIRRLTILALTVAAASTPLQGGIEWGGTGSTTATDDLLLITNWENGSAVPLAGAGGGNNEGVFDLSGNATPKLSVGEVLSIDKITFVPGAEAYEFDIQGSLNVVGNNSFSLYTNGVQNNSSNTQVFHIQEGGSVNFSNNSNAAFSGSSDADSVTYSLGDIADETSGSMSFSGRASAGGAKIFVNEESTVDFHDNSTASTASIELIADTFIDLYPVITFHDGSNAGSAQIDSTGSEVIFKDFSYADEATITLTGAPFVGSISIPAELDFSDFSSAGSSTINILDGSLVIFSDEAVAEDATLNLGTGATSLSPVGDVDFLGNSQAGNAVINVKGGYVRNGKTIKSTLLFDQNSKANNATINLGDASTGIGGKVMFYRSSDAENAVFNATQGSSIVFYDYSIANNSTITLNDSSALVFKGGAASATATIDLSGLNSSLEFGQVNDDTFSGKLIGFGSLSKTGLGTLHFQGDASGFLGRTYISGGILAVDSRLASDVSVSEGGALGGRGVVQGDVTVGSGGSLYPDAQTLTINGQLVQEADSVYYVAVDASGANSNIQVNGSVVLNEGARINIANVATSQQLAPNETISKQVMAATDGISGSYGTLASENPLIFGAIVEDGNSVSVTFSNTLSTIGSNDDHWAVGTELQKIQNPSEEEQKFLYQLATLPKESAELVFDSLSAEQYSNLIVAAEMSNEQFLQRLLNPIRPVLTSDPCCPDTCCNAARQGLVWIDGGFQRSFLHGSVDAKGFKSKGYEMTVGAQAPLPADWLLGTAICYEHTLYDFNLNGSSHSNAIIAALYALYRPADYYFLTDFLYGYSKQKLQRSVEVGTKNYYVNGKPEVFQGTLYAEMGKDFRYCAFLFQPFLGLEGGYYKRTHVTEHSHKRFIAPAHIRESSRGMGHTRLGVHVSTESWCDCKASFDFAWRYRFTSLNNDMHARFQNFGGEYVIEGVKLKRNSFDGAIDITMKVCDCWSVYIEAAGQWWEKAAAYTLLTGTTISW